MKVYKNLISNIPIFKANCVIHLDKKDKRYNKFKKQIKTRGFAGSELWSLDYTIMCFILPRLKQYKKDSPGWPGWCESRQEWEIILQKMIKSLELMVENRNILTKQEEKEITQGWNLFKKHFFSLWY